MFGDELLPSECSPIVEELKQTSWGFQVSVAIGIGICYLRWMTMDLVSNEMDWCWWEKDMDSMHYSMASVYNFELMIVDKMLALQSLFVMYSATSQFEEDANALQVLLVFS